MDEFTKWLSLAEHAQYKLESAVSLCRLFWKLSSDSTDKEATVIGNSFYAIYEMIFDANKKLDQMVGEWYEGKVKESCRNSDNLKSTAV